MDDHQLRDGDESVAGEEGLDSRVCIVGEEPRAMRLEVVVHVSSAMVTGDEHNLKMQF